MILEVSPLNLITILTTHMLFHSLINVKYNNRIYDLHYINLLKEYNGYDSKMNNKSLIFGPTTSSHIHNVLIRM